MLLVQPKGAVSCRHYRQDQVVHQGQSLDKPLRLLLLTRGECDGHLESLFTQPECSVQRIRPESLETVSLELSGLESVLLVLSTCSMVLTSRTHDSCSSSQATTLHCALGHSNLRSKTQQQAKASGVLRSSHCNWLLQHYNLT